MEFALIAEKLVITQFIRLKQEKKKIKRVMRDKIRKYEEEIEEVKSKSDELNDLFD